MDHKTSVDEMLSRADRNEQDWKFTAMMSAIMRSLCCTPMPTSLSRLSSCLSSILSFLECPICFEIISPPAHQCPLGHLICFRCRVYIDRCPICRTGFTRERSLLADQIYNAIIEAFHLNHHSTSERTKKLWERVFGRSKKREKQPPASQPATPKIGRAFDLKNKFLTRLMGKSSSVDNLANESAFNNNAAALRKKSISSTDIYPESLKQLGGASLNDTSTRCSFESLPGSPRPENGVTFSRYSSVNNSCETLNVGRNVQYYKRLRNRNLAATDSPAENLFQFSSDAINGDHNDNNNDDNDDDENAANESFYCPLSDGCGPRTAFSLLTHLQEHDGPVIQYFKPQFTVHFPFSFGNGAVFVVHCLEKTFYTKLDVDETTTTATPKNDDSGNGDDIRVRFWIMDNRTEANRYRLKVTLRNEQSNALLEFKTTANSIRSTQMIDDVYRHQILIARSTLKVCFSDRFFSLDLNIKKRKL